MAPGETMDYRTLHYAIDGRVATITLDRPGRMNAINLEMPGEIADAVDRANRDDAVHVVVLTGAGEGFCSGYDLKDFAEAAGERPGSQLGRGAAEGGDPRAWDPMADYFGMYEFTQQFMSLWRSYKPTIARVHGAAYGGGVGLVACCDIAVAAAAATFALSEAKLGLIPATIGPYVIEAIGARAARRYFLTAERFDAAEARRIGLVHELAPTPEALDARVSELLGALMRAGPHAQAAAKALVRAVAHRPIDERVVADTAERIAAIRASDEAREGIVAFLTRRSPAWVPEALRKKGK